jgi:uncharacterized protein YjbI with pentapeptide repeats
LYGANLTEADLERVDLTRVISILAFPFLE